MSNTINIGGIQVSKFYLGGSSDVKIYLGTTKLYPHLQEPCFAVVADISQYSDRTYVDVFNLADNKWYKLNNLNQYEQYGIYGSGRTICTGASFTELTDIIAQSTTALTNHNITVTPAVGAFSKIRIDTTKSATTTSYTWATFTPTPNGSEVLGINMDSIGAMNGYGNNKNYVTDANGSQTFAHWVDDNNTIVEIDIAALSNNQASELYLLFYQENCKPAAFSFYIESTNCVTTYDGKLTIDTESTPQPSRLPQGYTEVEYIRQNSNYDAYINTGVILFDNTSNTYTVTTKLASEFHSNLGCATIISCERVNSPYDGLGYRYKCSSTVDQLEFFGGNPNYSSSSVDNGDGTRTITFTNTGNSSFTTDVPLSYMAAFSSTTYGANASWRHSDSTIYSATVVKNGVTVRDFVPAKRDSDDKYGLYDLITDTFYTSPNGNNFSGGSEVMPPPITTTYEYMYSGGSWINLGEVSGSTQIIKSPEYIEKDSSHNGKINLDYIWKTNSKMQFKFYSTNNGGGAMIGEDGVPDNNDCRMFFASTTAYFDWGSSRISWSSNGRTNTLYEYEYGNYYIKNMVTSASKTGSTISTSRTNTLYFGLGGTDRFRTYYLKFYDGDTLVKDFIPWTDTNGNYGLYEKVSNTIYSATSGSFTASSVWNDVEVGGGYKYPLEYVVREDPPDNLVFSSMAEAEAYECPWVGMKATIDGDKYVFSGDSQSGYEWVLYSRIPSAYTEVEYVQNTGNSTVNLGIQLMANVGDTFNIVLDNETSWTSGGGNYQTFLTCYNESEGNYKGFYYRYNTSSSTLVIGGNSGVVTSSGRTLVSGSTYHTTINGTTPSNMSHNYPLNLFSSLDSTQTPWRFCKGKLYNMQVTYNNTLVRDLVPCYRKNDNVAGLYDLVNNVFYTSESGYDALVAGNPV